MRVRKAEGANRPFEPLYTHHRDERSVIASIMCTKSLQSLRSIRYPSIYSFFIARLVSDLCHNARPVFFNAAKPGIVCKNRALEEMGQKTDRQPPVHYGQAGQGAAWQAKDGQVVREPCAPKQSPIQLHLSRSVTQH